MDRTGQPDCGATLLRPQDISKTTPFGELPRAGLGTPPQRQAAGRCDADGGEPETQEAEVKRCIPLGPR